MQDIQLAIRDYQQRHLGDKDGGYAEEIELAAYYGRLSPRGREIFIELFLESVAVGQNANIFLYVFSEPAGRRLHALLNSSSSYPPAWKARVVQALLKNSYAPAAVDCVQYLREEMQRGNSVRVQSIVPLLYRVDRESYLIFVTEILCRLLERQKRALNSKLNRNNARLELQNVLTAIISLLLDSFDVDLTLRWIKDIFSRVVVAHSDLEGVREPLSRALHWIVKSNKLSSADASRLMQAVLPIP